MLQFRNKIGCLAVWKHICIQDLKNLLFSLSRFAYFGAIASLLNALLDAHEIYLGFLDIHIYKNDIKIKTAIFRCATNLLLGLAGFFPFFIMFAWVLVNPLIVPVISLGIVVANLFKAYRTYKITKYELSIDQAVLKNNPNEDSLSALKDTQAKLYTAQKEVVINSILTIGSVISVFGVFFPPLLIVGMGLAVTGSILGILDNKFQFGVKILALFQKNKNIMPCIKSSSNTPANNPVKNSHVPILKKINSYPANLPKKIKNVIEPKESFIRGKKLINNIFATIKECKQEIEENNKLGLTY